MRKSVLLLILLILPIRIYSEKIFMESFYDLKGWEYQTSGPPKFSDVVDTNLALNDGNNSVLKIFFPRSAYDISDPGRRVEIKRHDAVLTKWEVERWFALSIFVPHNHPIVGYHILQQFHSVEDKGEMPRSPVLMIGIEENETWGGQIRYSENKINADGNKSTIPLSIPWIAGNPKVLKGEWSHWVYNIVFDWRAGGKGKCRIWLKDSGHPEGELVADYKGQIGFNDEKPHYVRMGIYYCHYDLNKWSPSTPDMTVFFDRFIVGDSLENFESMVYTDVTNVIEVNPYSDMRISPNPASDYIEISQPSESLKPSEGSIVKIYNTFGECVISVETQDFASLQRINISHLPIGLYFIQIGNDTVKLMVMR